MWMFVDPSKVVEFVQKLTHFIVLKPISVLTVYLFRKGDRR
jgi:hypothetical protein